MALEVDALLDRRRLTRRVSFWRGVAILTVIVALAATGLSVMDIGRTHIARLPVQGAIVSDRPLVRLIERLGEDENVSAVLVAIDSPGGTSVGGERLYTALRELAEKKPVVAHINTLGASAAYMTALGTDHIVAQRSSLTGSVGVLIQYGQVDELLDELGIRIAKVDSGPLKAEPSPFQPVDQNAVDMLQSVVDDTFDYFLSLVEERRELGAGPLSEVADGRIYTGAQALEVGLVDALGGEDSALEWLESERDVPASLPLIEYEADDDRDFSLTARITDRVLERLFAAAGMPLPPVDGAASVDGLWSLWHGGWAPDNKVVQQ